VNAFIVLIKVAKNILKVELRNFFHSFLRQPLSLFYTLLLMFFLYHSKIVNTQQFKNICLHFDAFELNNFFTGWAFLCYFCIAIIILVAHLVDIVKLIHSIHKFSIVQHFLAARTCWL